MSSIDVRLDNMHRVISAVAGAHVDTLDLLDSLDPGMLPGTGPETVNRIQSELKETLAQWRLAGDALIQVLQSAIDSAPSGTLETRRRSAQDIVEEVTRLIQNPGSVDRKHITTLMEDFQRLLVAPEGSAAEEEQAVGAKPKRPSAFIARAGRKSKGLAHSSHPVQRTVLKRKALY